MLKLTTDLTFHMIYVLSVVLLENCLGLTDFLVAELFKFIAFCVAVMSLFLPLCCSSNFRAVSVIWIRELYWKSEFYMPHLCRFCVGHLSTRLVISSHLAVGVQNSLMDIQAIQVYLYLSWLALVSVVHRLYMVDPNKKNTATESVVIAAIRWGLYNACCAWLEVCSIGNNITCRF